MIAVLLLASCSTAREPPAAQPPAKAGEAQLISIGGSAVRGSVGVVAGPTSLTLQVSLAGMAAGAYRVVLHTTGNCSSPNGFSAGPPWIIPGSAGPAVFEVAAYLDSTLNASRRFGGFAPGAADSVIGRSVVVHAGRIGPLEAVPDQPNDRIACGVIGPAQSIF